MGSIWAPFKTWPRDFQPVGALHGHRGSHDASPGKAGLAAGAATLAVLQPDLLNHKI